jgi:hypothetical protein
MLSSLLFHVLCMMDHVLRGLQGIHGVMVVYGANGVHEACWRMYCNAHVSLFLHVVSYVAFDF